MAGVDVAADGACNTAQVCGGFTGAVCPTGAFCDYEPNSCGIADQQGTCRDIPALCPGVFMPVCGCDGQTHSNACEAARAGTDVASPGPCP